MSRFDKMLTDDPDLWERWMELFGERCECTPQDELTIEVCWYCAQRLKMMEVTWQ